MGIGHSFLTINTRKGGVDLTGKRFGRLLVLGLISRRERRSRGSRLYWLCRCDCGNKATCPSGSLRAGSSRSCGCLAAEKRKIGLKRKHGHAVAGAMTPEYVAWQGMLQRCLSKTHRSYASYGARGITVCGRWQSSFENFLADMGYKPSPYHSLDRYPDNCGHYGPDNCRWATPNQQANNLRTNRNLEAFGRVQSHSMWAREIGIATSTIAKRLKAGASPEQALRPSRFTKERQQWRP